MSLARLLAAPSYDTLRAPWLARYAAAGLDRGRGFALVGAAGWAAPLVEAAVRRGVAVCGVFDDALACVGTRCGGVVVQPMEACRALDRATPLVLGTHHVGPLTERLRTWEFAHVLPYALLHEADPSWPANPFYAGLLADLWAQRARYAVLADTLADDTSRAVLDAAIAFRLDLDATGLIPHCRGDAYFAEVRPVGASEVFIDGGAYTGDSFVHFRAWCGDQFRAAFLFEPDPENFAQLCCAIGDDPRVRCVLGALAAHDGTAAFARDAGRTAHLGAEGALQVRTAALDAFPPAAAATFLKLNIEGAELAALHGAADLLRRTRPQLAVAVYHRPDHLWRIAEFLQALGVPYRLSLRQHAPALIETVLYAVSEGRN